MTDIVDELEKVCEQAIIDFAESIDSDGFHGLKFRSAFQNLCAVCVQNRDAARIKAAVDFLAAGPLFDGYNPANTGILARMLAWACDYAGLEQIALAEPQEPGVRMSKPINDNTPP